MSSGKAPTDIASEDHTDLMAATSRRPECDCGSAMGVKAGTLGADREDHRPA